MPIFYNFHILLATFYTIFVTNILIQCLVPVPVCYMFYVSQKPNIKRSPNGIKTDGELFWNICDFWEVKSTRDGARGAHEMGGAPQGGRRTLDSCGHPVRRLTLFFAAIKLILWEKSGRKIHPNRSYGSPDIKETVKGQNLEHRNRERDRETDPISEGLSPLRRHGNQGL